jgi:hypothetical protein
MKPSKFPLFVATIPIVIGLAAFGVPAQARKAKTTASSAKAVAAARKLRALQLIDEVLSDAKLLDDLETRAMFQARAAYAVWPAEPVRAREVFRQAWATAAEADLTALPASFQAGSDAELSPANNWTVRSRVLSLVARRDRKLADEFIDQLAPSDTTEIGSEANPAETKATSPWGQLSQRSIVRLNLAREQLAAGDPVRAAAIAAPVIQEGAMAETLEFLVSLWGVDAVDAERLYLSLIARVRIDRNDGANDALLLSVPIVSPELMMVVDLNGSLLLRPLRHSDGPLVMSPATRAQFFAASTEILLQPVVSTGTSGLTPDAVARFLAGERLLPFLAREAPQFAEGIRLRDATLANEIDPNRRDQLNVQLAGLTYPVNRTSDPLRDQTDELSAASDPKVRDGIALRMVLIAARRRMWDRAKVSADKIVDIDNRRAALSFIQLSQIADLTRAAGDDRETDYLGFASFVRKADVPPLATAWGLAQSALIAKRQGKIADATALFTEASTYVVKTESGSDQRVAAFVMLGNLIMQHDQRKVWFIIPDIVHAADAMDDYQGDDGFSGVMPNFAPTVSLSDEFSVTSDDFRIDRLFAALAKLDFDRTADLARSFGQRLAKMDAMLSVAKVELDHGAGGH